jgi:ketosteroid isomerase-like protein
MSTHDLDTSDEIQVRAAVQRYAFAIDAMDYDALRDVFTPDATAQYHQHPLLTGNQSIADFLKERVGDTIWHQHFISVTRVELSGDTAQADSAFIAHATKHSIPGKVRMTLGSYHDRLARTSDGWRVAHRDQVTGIREVRDLGDPNG